MHSHVKHDSDKSKISTHLILMNKLQVVLFLYNLLPCVIALELKPLVEFVLETRCLS